MLAGESTTIVEHAAEWQEQALWAAGCESDIEMMVAAVSKLRATLALLPAGFTAILPRGTSGTWQTVRRGCWIGKKPGAAGCRCMTRFTSCISRTTCSARPQRPTSTTSRRLQTIGIAPEQCRRLEIAYLASTYLQQLTRHESQHAEFLLDGLGVELERDFAGSRGGPASLNKKRSRDLAQAPTPPAALRIRNELLSAFLAQLNSSDIRYCLLSGYDTCPEKVTSDVDFMVHPEDMYRVAPLLSQVAHVAGGALVQAIPHETWACHFVIAKDDGSPIGYFDPDCTGDYRKQGRLWLSAERCWREKGSAGTSMFQRWRTNSPTT